MTPNQRKAQRRTTPTVIKPNETPAPGGRRRARRDRRDGQPNRAQLDVEAAETPPVTECAGCGWAVLGLPGAVCLSCASTPEAIRNRALEEAAKACDAVASHTPNPYGASVADRCATNIRALKTK